MKICHITTVHPPKDARIFYRMCRALAARQLDVVLVAPGGFASEQRLRASKWNEAIAQNSRLSRAPLALRAAVAEHADVYHFHDPEFIPVAAALKLLRPRSAVVYDVHEDYPSMMRDKYWLPRRLRPAAQSCARLANWLANRLLDGVVVADPGVAEDFRRIRRTGVLIHYNFPSLELFMSSQRTQSAPEVDLVYIGGLSERAGVLVLFDALEQLALRGIKPSVRLAGYTDGEEGLALVKAAISRCGLGENVEFHGRLPHEQVPGWLGRGRIGLVLLQAVPKFMKNIPSKMFEYWACGLPVLASDLPPARRFLVNGENGYLFSPASSSELADRIADLLAKPELCQSMGQAGQRLVQERWNNESQVAALIRFYEALLRPGARKTLAEAAPLQARNDP